MSRPSVWMQRLAPVLAAGVALVASTLLPAAPAHGALRHTSAVAIRTNRVGLGIFSDTAWRFKLSESSNFLLKDTYFDAGVVTQLSPATLHPGVFVETVPVAFLKLRASVQRLQYFGYFGSLGEYPDGNFDKPALDRSDREGLGKRTGGYFYDARASLRGKFWRLVSTIDGQVSHFDVQADAPVHDPVSDLLVEPEDEVYQLRSMLGFMVVGEAARPGSLMAGGIHQYFQTAESDVTRQILGALVMVKPPTDFWSTGDPSLAILAGSFIEDPYRTGELYLGTLLTLTFAEDPRP